MDTGHDSDKAIMSVRLTLLAVLLAGLQVICCSVPPGYAKRMGWEVKENHTAGTPYEMSLRAEYLEDGENDPQNRWRIHNKVMNYLARKKAQTKPIEPPDLFDLLAKISQLNVVADSAEIKSLYSAVFAAEDKQWGYEGNYYVDSVLYSRALQTIDEKGFDILRDDFNELGLYIAQHGPLETVERSFECKVYLMPAHGIYLKTGEDKYYSTIVIGASRCPLTCEDLLSTYSEPGAGDTCIIPGEEQRELMARAETSMSVPVAYDELEVNDVKITRFPCPANGAMEGELYQSTTWDRERLIATVSIKTQKLRGNQGLRLEHLVFGEKKTDDETSGWGQITSGTKEIKYEAGEDNATFIARTVTEPLMYGDYEIQVKVSSGEKEHVESRRVRLDETIPVELVAGEPLSVLGDAYLSGTVPFFHSGSVSKGDTLTAFFAVKDLGIDGEGVYHEGELYFVLYEPTQARPRIEITDYQAYPLGVEPDEFRDTDQGYPDGSAQFGEIFLFQDHVKLEYPNGPFKVQFVLPKTTKPGTYMLGLRVLTRGLGGEVRLLGYGERPMQVR